ncbi:metal-dependent hydrolase [soil metagenome]
MDNLCHTLVGAALGEAGLKRLTPWGNAALMIAANLPDVDAVALLADTPHVALRRGWTHGIVAQGLLPILLTGAIVAVDRAWARRRGREPRVRPAAMLFLAYVGVLSHVFLDYLNVYGVRLLKPLSDRWFYGDALFIIDPWLWIVLAAGVIMSRRWRSLVPAGTALGLAGLYIAGMMWLSSASRQIVIKAWSDTYGGPPRALMVGPVPLNPLEKEIIVDAGDRYVTGHIGWWPRQVRFEREPIMKNDDGPSVARAREHPDVRAVLVWARFPHYLTVPTESGVRVTLQDARYGPRVGATSVTVER